MPGVPISGEPVGGLRRLAGGVTVRRRSAAASEAPVLVARRTAGFVSVHRLGARFCATPGGDRSPRRRRSRPVVSTHLLERPTAAALAETVRAYQSGEIVPTDDLITDDLVEVARAAEEPIDVDALSDEDVDALLGTMLEED